MTLDNAIEELKGFQDMIRSDPSKKDLSSACDMAIMALNQIQKYWEIGTVKECREMASMISKTESGALDRAINEWLEYVKIGTVEECQAAMEKQKPKKPVLRNDNGKLRKSCPVCGCFFSPLSKSCPKCGQTLKTEE